VVPAPPGCLPGDRSTCHGKVGQLGGAIGVLKRPKDRRRRCDPVDHLWMSLRVRDCEEGGRSLAAKQIRFIVGIAQSKSHFQQLWLSVLHWGGRIWGTAPSAGLPSSRQTGNCWGKAESPGSDQPEEDRGAVISSGGVQNPPGCFPVRPALGNLL